MEEKRFRPSILIDNDNKAITMVLEDVPYYAEWIKGEGSDISVYRAMDDGRAVGCRLPLKNGIKDLPVSFL